MSNTSGPVEGLFAISFFFIIGHGKLCLDMPGESQLRRTVPKAGRLSKRMLPDLVRGIVSASLKRNCTSNMCLHFEFQVDLSNFSLELFENDFHHKQPLVLTGLVPKWPATREWTWEQLTDPKGQPHRMIRAQQCCFSMGKFDCSLIT